jgi:N-acetylated-alpha-linked acidic dipeptidase
MLETVHGIGQLLKTGWKPKRTIIFASWDAEEEGLIGSTEWGEQHAADLATSPAYFNMDVAVSGPNLSASAVPSLKQFIREITKSVPSPRGGSVYEEWRKSSETAPPRGPQQEAAGSTFRPPAVHLEPDVAVGDLGSGSDFTVFLQRLGVPSTDIGSTGPYGVYHSVFDNFQWFKKFGDPDFLYEQEMARIFGLEVLRMASADVLPYDYAEYGKEVANYLTMASKKADSQLGHNIIDFRPALDAAKKFQQAGSKMLSRQINATDPVRMNRALCETERALLIPGGLPNRPWYRHAIYAPGVYTGYAAVVIPGINEAIDQKNASEVTQQVALLVDALHRAAKTLEKY